MQPHSMCALAMANIIWNSYDESEVSSAKMDVSYRNKYNEYKTNKYELSNIRIISDREFTVLILRGGGGISCTMTVRRKKLEEGTDVEMTHSQNHVSGLREVFRLSKNKIGSGLHYNSMKYRCFAGEGSHPERKALNLVCEIKKDDGKFFTAKYELTVTGLVRKIKISNYKHSDKRKQK